MPLDLERLLRYPIPDVRHHLDRHSTALYALSVGLGIDPLDRQSLDFVDFNRPGFQALPLMAVVAAYPGFWLGKPDTGVDATRLVLGEQRVEWHRQLPTEGEVIGRTRVTGIVDKGPGKGALLYSDKELIDPVAARSVARCRQPMCSPSASRIVRSIWLPGQSRRSTTASMATTTRCMPTLTSL
jgi:hypothetical protein